MRFFLVAFLSALASAQDPVTVRSMSLVTGRGELLQFGRDVGRVVISEPKIADAIIVSPRDVMVTGKGAGHTTLVVWENDSAPVRYDISVVTDTSEHDALYKNLLGELKNAMPQTTIAFSGNAESLVLTGNASSSESQRAQAIAASYTKKVVNLIQTPDPKQILLQVKFASVDREALNQVGVNLFSTNRTMLGATSTQQFQQPLFSQLQFQNGQFQGTNVNLSNLLNLFLFRPDLDIGATVEAMEQKNLLQILAEPNLIVLEGSEASFLAGGEFPYPTITSTPTTAGTSPVVTVQFRKFGVQLNFTPTLTASGAIQLKVKPEVSALDYNNAVTLNGFVIPALSSRVAETEVVLKDGESFAIAGLIDNRVTQVATRLKFLGDIPILGQLFRSNATKKSADELLVVVTPRFVKPLVPGDKAALPDLVIPYLPTVAEQQAAKDAKKKDATKDKDKKDKPEFVGPRGHEVPRQ
jgi:pilus assembly protein CpaC